MEEEEEAPTLQLEILQGPRQGQTLNFKAGTAIRIGRVVKGNNLPIKDSGISSKHLSILTEFNKWILRDLHSSNGTVLDGSQIPPNTPFTLHHDSTIKIGELTSIHVTFVPRQQQQQHAAQPRRNPTRRGRTEPDPAQASSQPVQPRGRGRGRPLKSKVQIQSVEENDNDASVVHAESERVGPPARVTRKSNRERSVVRVCDDAAEEKVEEPKSTRNLSLVEVSDSCVGNSGAPVVVVEPKNTRMTRNSKSARGVTAGNVEKEAKRVVTEKRKLEKEGENLNGVKEACDGNLNGNDGNWPDLNKMTLGEWFDFLEVHLPKQIIDETEETIDSMTQTAESLREYIIEMQQQNGKAKMPVEE